MAAAAAPGDALGDSEDADSGDRDDQCRELHTEKRPGVAGRLEDQDRAEPDRADQEREGEELRGRPVAAEFRPVGRCAAAVPPKTTTAAPTRPMLPRPAAETMIETRLSPPQPRSSSAREASGSPMLPPAWMSTRAGPWTSVCAARSAPSPAGPRMKPASRTLAWEAAQPITEFPASHLLMCHLARSAVDPLVKRRPHLELPEPVRTPRRPHLPPTTRSPRPPSGPRRPRQSRSRPPARC